MNLSCERAYIRLTLSHPMAIEVMSICKLRQIINYTFEIGKVIGVSSQSILE